MSWELCNTPPQTPAKFLTLDFMDPDTTAITLKGASIAEAVLIAVAIHMAAAVVASREAIDIIALSMAESIKGIFIHTAIDIKEL